MLISITAEQAQQAIPDANSQKAAKKLSKQEDWSNKGASEEQWIWGEITGSAIYQSAIFLPELKFECSCPSFKRPCKHALGLLLCYTEHQHLFPLVTEQPERVKKWIEKKQKTVKKLDPNEPVKEVDLEARAKRIAAREKKVDDGLQALDLWLQDLLRLGLAKARQDSYSLFNQMTTRLTDAQATGLISWLEALHTALFTEQWQQDCLPWLGRLNLVVQLWQRRSQLDAQLQTELRQLIGFNLAPDQLAALPVEQQQYWTIGHKLGELSDGKGRYRRQWLWQAEQQQAALLLDFEIGSFTNFPLALPLSQLQSLALQFYPSPTPSRAKLADTVQIATPSIEPKPQQTSQLQAQPQTQPQGAFYHFEQALQQHAMRLSRNPLLTQSCWLIDAVSLRIEQENLYAVDQKQAALDLQIVDRWKLLAAVGDEPFLLAAEWNGQQLDVISVWQHGQLTCFY
jgi:hypothetical protein